MRIEKSLEIRKSSAEVFEYLRYTRNHDNFSVWNMTDPGMKKEYRGTDGTLGFVYIWDSTNKNVGAGEQETIGMDEGKNIEYALRFFRPMQSTAKARFEITAKGEYSVVSWIFDSPSQFPMSLLSPVFRILLGRDLSKGLSNLKAILEKT